MMIRILRAHLSGLLSLPRDPIRRVRIGKRDVLTRGIAPSFWTDVYHAALMVGWPAFLGGLAAVFVLINGVFAILYDLSANGVANADGRLLDLFFFSVETLTTVGYGEFYPQTDYAHVVVSIETFVGLFFTASMLGLIFARVSRPRARLLFADKLTVGPYEGRRTLFLRVANARLNLISSANARLWFLVSELTSENYQFRRFQELPLIRSDSPTFVLSWTVMHVIDETSPLFGRTAEDLAVSDALIILTVTGDDETSGQTVQARETYQPADILWDHRYADILTTLEDGTSILDYRAFHDVEPLAPSDS